MLNFNTSATAIETAFNIVDSIPVLAIPGSAMRINAAQIQLAVAAVFTFFTCIAYLVQTAFSGNSKFDYMIYNSYEHILHGALNFIRGLGEFFLAFTIIGSVIPLTYQCTSKNGFSPIIKYDNIN